MQKNILIIGGGAMGSLLASRIKLSFKNRVRVGILTNQIEQIQRIKLQNGLLFKSSIYEDKKVCSAEVGAFSSTKEILQYFENQNAKYAFIAVKGERATRLAVSKASELLDNCGTAISLQNGFGSYEIMTEVLGEDRVLIGTTTSGATITEPGTVFHHGEGEIQLIENALSKFSANNRAVKLSKFLSEANFNVKIMPYNMRNSVIQHKALINCAINPITAVLGVRNGFLYDNQDVCQTMIKNVISEFFQVANEKSIKLNFLHKDTKSGIDDISMKAYYEIMSVCKTTRNNVSSMLYDILNKRPTEVDAINGKLSEYGRELGIPTPTNDILISLIKALELKNSK